MASVSISCPSCSATDGVVRNGAHPHTPDIRPPPGLVHLHRFSPERPLPPLQSRRPPPPFTSLPPPPPGSNRHDCSALEMDEQWGYVGAKSRQRWLFYAYDRIRRTWCAFGERRLWRTTRPQRLLSLLSAFEVVVWMTDGWPLYESRLKGKLHSPISKRYTQRIERHNLNLRQHLARLGRKSLSFSRQSRALSNIKHYQ